MTKPQTTIPEYLLEAATELRRLGWSILPPRTPEIPEPVAGQVWQSPKSKVEPRTVVRVGGHRSWPGEKCVFFTSPSRPPHKEYGPSALHIAAWKKWAKAANARPE